MKITWIFIILHGKEFKRRSNQVDVTIARHGKFGYSEHTYLNISDDSKLRLLNATPHKPTMIVGNMIVYELS